MDTMDAEIPKPGAAKRTKGINIDFVLSRMSRYVVEGCKELTVIDRARSIAEAAAIGAEAIAYRGSDHLIHLRGIYAWGRKHWRFMADPIGTELIQTPHRMIREMSLSGDADEAAVLVLSLAAAIGIEPLAFRVGLIRDAARHVWGRAHVDGRWIDIDILHEKFGRHEPFDSYSYEEIDFGGAESRKEIP